MIEYERCFIRKMRSIFQYFDANGDGKVSSEEVLDGLNKLRKYRTALENADDAKYCFDDEELLRCLPSPDKEGNFTLDAILESSVPKLQLLQ